MEYVKVFLKVLEDVETEEPKTWLKNYTKIVV